MVLESTVLEHIIAFNYTSYIMAKKVYNFVKRMVRGYFELSAQNYAMRCTGNVWINPKV